MAFTRRTGKTKAMWFPKAASTAIAEGAALVFSSGYVTPATSTSPILAGISRKTVASTDSDYASHTLIPVEVPVEDGVKWEALTASAVATDIGVACDLTDSVTVNRGGTSHKVVTITDVIDATHVLVVLNSFFGHLNGA